MATKSKTFPWQLEWPSWSTQLTNLLSRRPFWACALALGIVVGGRIAWQANEAELARQSHLVLEKDEVFVSPQPAWIKSNVADSTLKSAELEGKSLLDPDLLEQVQSAFALQTWVKQVREVRKSARGIFVQLDYRRPIAMVEIQYEDEPRFQPVDDQAVLLPGNEFSQNETWNYLKIAVPAPATSGLVHGAPWPDPRIQAAARLAEKLDPVAGKLGIYRIQLVPASTPHEPPAFELHLVNADRYLCRRVLWGHGLDDETLGEATADAKIQAMLDYAANHNDWLPKGTDFQLDSFHFDVRSGTVKEVGASSTNLPRVSNLNSTLVR